MSISIQTNVTSLMAQENLSVNSTFESQTIQRLTSGYKINSSGDDAAGLAVANQYRADIAELTQGVQNANNGVSTLQIIDGGLNNISTQMDRMKTLAAESASGTFSGSRATLDTEYQQLVTEISRQAANINLNSGGTFNTSLQVYIGGSRTSNVAGSGQISVDRFKQGQLRVYACNLKHSVPAEMWLRVQYTGTSLADPVLGRPAH